MTHKTEQSWIDAFVNFDRCATCDANIIHYKLAYSKIMSSCYDVKIKIRKIYDLCDSYQIYDCCKFKLIAYYGFPNLPIKGG